MKERQRRKKIIKCLLLGATLLIMILIPISINVASKQEIEKSNDVKEEEGKVSTFLAENRITISEEDSSSSQETTTQSETTQAEAVNPKKTTVTTVDTEVTKPKTTTTTVVNKVTKPKTTTVTTVVTKVTKPETTTSISVTEAIETSAETSKEETSGNPVVRKTMNCSAYNLSGKTASGAQTQQWHTIAAGKSYPFGTRVYIPYFKNSPNGGWFEVQDRGGAITDNHLDIYMPSYDDCINFGRRNLEVEIYLP